MEGRSKVTGGLRYSGDQSIGNVAYGYLVTSTIARGEVRAMDVSETEKSSGVVAVYTPFHSLKLYDGLTQEEGANSGEIDPPLQDNILVPCEDIFNKKTGGFSNSLAKRTTHENHCA